MKFTTFFRKKRQTAENQHFTKPSFINGGGYILLCVLALIVTLHYSCKKEHLTTEDTSNQPTNITEKVIPINLEANLIDGALHFATTEQENKAIGSIIGKPFKSIEAWNKQHSFVSLYDVYNQLMEAYNEDTLANYKAIYGDAFYYPLNLDNDMPRIQGASLLKSMLVNPKGEYFVGETLVKHTKNGIYRITNPTPERIAYALTLHESDDHEGILFEENSFLSGDRLECPVDEDTSDDWVSGEKIGTDGKKYRIKVNWEWHKVIVANGNSSSVRYYYMFDCRAQKKGIVWAAINMTINELDIDIEVRRYDPGLPHIFVDHHWEDNGDNCIITSADIVNETNLTVAQLADRGCICENFDFVYHISNSYVNIEPFINCNY